MADYLSYFNGEWIPFSQVKIDPSDRGFLLGDTVFDAGRTFNGKSFRMKEHIDRLYRSLKYVRIDPGLSPDEMLAINEEAIERNEHLRAAAGDFVIWTFVTRGPGRWTHTAGPPTVCVKVLDIDWDKYLPSYLNGAHAVIARTRSYSADSLDPKIKHFSRMNFNLAELEVADIDPEGWALLLDSSGNLTEGTGWSVFVVTDGVLRAPPDDAILQSVSRQMVFDIAHRLGIPAYQENLQPYDLYTADEVFFTGTSPCILPVSRVDSRQIADGSVPQPVTRHLLAAWGEEVGLDIVEQAVRYGHEG